MGRFLGSWTTESHFDNYFLPLGEEIAGGHEYVERSIQSSLNTSLVYNSTFYVSSGEANELFDFSIELFES